MQRREKKMKVRFIVAAALLLLVLVVGQAMAETTILWQEGFENYNLQSGQTWGSLDKNDSAGPNKQSTNPWWGTGGEPNMFVTQATKNAIPVEEIVTPHSGQMMARGNRSGNGWANGADYDNANVNLAYRFNNGQYLMSSFSLDWWFYDILGNDHPGDVNLGPGNFGDYVSLSYAPTNAPLNADYKSGVGNFRSWSDIGAQLALGAIEDIAGYDGSVYQAYVKNGVGLKNTSIARTKGWHHAAIVVDKNNIANFYIDDALALSTDSKGANGFNVLTIRGCWSTPDTYNQSAYYDDFTLAKIPEPGSFVALGVGLVSLLGLRRRRS